MSAKKVIPAEFKVVRVRECRMDSRVVDTPERVAEVWRDHVETSEWWDPTAEAFVAFMLTTRSNLIGFHMVAIGGCRSCVYETGRLFRAALLAGATRLVVSHNHPSGDPSPSQDDIQLTKRIMKAGEILGVEVLDMVIVGSATSADKHFSLREHGYLS